MNLNYKTAIEFTLGWEVGRDKKGNLREDGGYTNIPGDPGGETKWGISKRAHPTEDIKNMPLSRALEIYKQEYWDVYKKQDPAIDLDTAARDLSVVIFDSGVNCGVRRCNYWYIKAMKAKDPTKVLLGLRDKHYFDLISSNGELKKFYKGWMARMNDLKKLVDIIKAEDHPKPHKMMRDFTGGAS